MTRSSILITLLLVAIALVLVSCGGGMNSTQTTSGLTFRVFVSNPLQPASGGGGAPVLNIVDATKDTLSQSFVSLTGILEPGLMTLFPSKQLTFVFNSAPNVNSVTIISNATESVASTSAGMALPSPALGGFTDSLLVSADNLSGYAAVPTAPITGQSPGAVVVIRVATGTVSATLPVPNAIAIAESHNGNRLLAFDGTSTVTVITPSLIGSNSDPRTPVCCFDHPVWALFSDDDTTAYIFEAGPERGGTSAAITLFDLNTNTAGTRIPVDGATIGLLSGTTIYVAGTPPTPVGGNTCTGSTTTATNCGRLDVVDLNTLTVTSSAIITDGLHTKMELGANGRLFVGAQGCTNLNSSTEMRGCLSIFNTGTFAVVIPADNGDVTGIQPIRNRNVVYVAQGGELRIYDTTTDALQMKQISIIGKAIDVKLVD